MPVWEAGARQAALALEKQCTRGGLDGTWVVTRVGRRGLGPSDVSPARLCSHAYVAMRPFAHGFISAALASWHAYLM